MDGMWNIAEKRYAAAGTFVPLLLILWGPTRITVITEKGRMRIHEKWLVWNHLLNSWVATILERWRAAMNYGCVFELRYLIMYSKVSKKRTVSKNRTATEKIPPVELYEAFLPCQFGLAFLYFPFLFSSCFLFCKCHFNEDGCLHIKVKLMKEDGFGKKRKNCNGSSSFSSL